MSFGIKTQGDRTDKRDTSAFNTWKDIIIPGNVDDGMTKTGVPVVQPLPLSKRKYLANYLGRAQGKAGRLLLIELAKQFPNKVCYLPLLLNAQVNISSMECYLFGLCLLHFGDIELQNMLTCSKFDTTINLVVAERYQLQLT